MAWLLPELELGAEPELKPLELDPEFVPVLELEPEFVPVLELEPELADEPELVDVPLLEEDPELVDEPVLADVDDVVVCVDPGRARVTTPAATTLAMVTAVVVDRTLARPRSRAAMARRTLSRSTLLMSSILRPRIRSPLQETSRLAMRGTPLGQPLGPRLPSEDEGHLKPRIGSGRRRDPDQRAGADYFALLSRYFAWRAWLSRWSTTWRAAVARRGRRAGPAGREAWLSGVLERFS